MASQEHRRIQIINLSRNFGQIQAITCGIEHATGDAIIIMDADLQHPPDLLLKMTELWLDDGYDTVIPLNKVRTGQNLIYKRIAKFFYKAIDKMSNIHIPNGGSDFRLLNRKVINAIKSLPEKNRFIKALYIYPGFKSIEIDYSVRERNQGKSSWNIKKLWSLALDGIFGFSSLPLKIWTYIGFIISLSSFTYGAYIAIDTIIGNKTTPGWTTIVCLILFFNGLLMINNGIMGEYIARIFEEVKARPLYFIQDKIGFEE